MHIKQTIKDGKHMGKSSMLTFFFIRLQERLFYMLHCRATEVLSIYHALILLTVKYNHLEEHAATDKVNWQQVSEIIPHVKVSSGKTLNPALPPRHPWADVDHKLFFIDDFIADRKHHINAAICRSIQYAQTQVSTSKHIG